MAPRNIPHSKPATGPAEARAAARVIESGLLAQGREVAAFEAECAAFLGRRYAIATSSGTAALHLALAAAGVGSGDAVAIPSYACAALAQAIAAQRALPVLCDVDDDSNLNPESVPDALAAAIVAHLFGAAAKIPRAPLVVEDIAQSFGGSTGRATPVAITSFYATKMITTGEGGMIFTDDAGLADHARDLRDYDNRDDLRLRYACKMTDFQAAIGREQLARLPEFIARRAEIAATYHAGLEDVPAVRPRREDTVHFRYVIQTAEQDRLLAWLRGRGIGAARPVYRPAHHALGGEYPRSERAHRRNVSLPIYPALTTAELKFVVDSVVEFFEKASAP